MALDLSVVVIGRNEGQRLIACLESIRAARFGESAEVIYVDSNSTDGSPERAAAMGARVIALNSGKMTAARSRNEGWRSATAPIILFLDGDTTLHPDFVAKAMPEFENPQVAVVWGHRRESRPGASIYNRILDLDWIYPPGLTEFCGGDALMRRASLQRANGFDPCLIAGEEPDLCRRIRAFGDHILHLDIPMTSHDLAISRFGQYWRRAVRAGHAYAEIADRYRGSKDPLWARDARSNLIRGFLYLTGILVTFGAAIAFGTLLPALCGLIAAAVVMLRTATKSRWKGVSPSTLLLFGIHSHLQQIPVFQGQIFYFFERWRQRDSELIEYKSRP